MNTRTANVQLDIIDIMCVLCCVFTCMTGHVHTGFLISAARYTIFLLLIVAVTWRGIVFNWEIVLFCIINLCAAIVTAAYHCFAGSKHFLLFPSMTAVVYYCLFVYCGYYIAIKRWDTELLFHWIHIFSKAAGIILLMQILGHWQGIDLHKIPFFGEYLFHAVDSTKYFRPCAFFSEPSHLAEFVLLDLFSNLFRRKKIRQAGFNLLTLILSTSGLGIAFGYGLLVWWALSQRMLKNNLKNVLIKILLAVLLIAIVLLILGYTGDNALLNRLIEGGTIVQRTLRTFEIYSKLEPAEKIFGIGMQNLTSYLESHSLHLINDRGDTKANKEFAQSFGYMLCSLGIAGASSYLLYILTMLKKTSKQYWGIVFLFTGLSLTANLITRLIFILYIAAMWIAVFETQEDQTSKEEPPWNQRETLC